MAVFYEIQNLQRLIGTLSSMSLEYRAIKVSTYVGVISQKRKSLIVTVQGVGNFSLGMIKPCAEQN